MARKTVPLVRGQADAVLGIPGALTGAVEVRGWTTVKGLKRHGERRRVVLQNPHDLVVKATTYPADHRPGEMTIVRAVVTDRAGNPVNALVTFEGLEVVSGSPALPKAATEEARARLGPAWGPPVIGWNQEQLWAEGDLRRLDIATAALRDDVRGRVSSTKGDRAAQARTVFFPVMERRAKVISAALTRYYRDDAGRTGFGTTLDKLLALRLLKSQETLDPWGRTLKLVLDARRDPCKPTFSIRSDGIDGVDDAGRGRSDDIYVEAPLVGFFKSRPRCPRKKADRGLSGGGGLGFAGTGSNTMPGAYAPTPQERVAGPWPRALSPIPKSLLTDGEGKANWRIALPKGEATWAIRVRAVAQSGGLGGNDLEIRTKVPSR